jgi:hypothetical protein
VEASLGWISRNRAWIAAGVGAVLLAGLAKLVVVPLVAERYIREAEVATENARYGDSAGKLRVAGWLSPSDPRIESAWGQIEYSQGRYSEGHARFNRALRLSVESPGRLTNWQIACLLSRRSVTDLAWARALDAKQTVVSETESRRPLPEFIRERILEARGDLRRAKQLAGNDESLLYRIGMGIIHAEIHLAELAADAGDHLGSFQHGLNSQALIDRLRKIRLPRHAQATVWRLDVDNCHEATQNHLKLEMSRMLGME